MNTIKQKQKNCRRQISKITVQILPKAVTLKKTQFHWPVIPPQQPWPSCRVVVYCCCTFFLKNDFSSRGPDSNVSNELVRRSRDVVRIRCPNTRRQRYTAKTFSAIGRSGRPSALVELPVSAFHRAFVLGARSSDLVSVDESGRRGYVCSTNPPFTRCAGR